LFQPRWLCNGDAKGVVGLKAIFDTDENCALSLKKKALFDFRHFLPKITLVEYREKISLCKS
jgi:hypothetical protein